MITEEHQALTAVMIERMAQDQKWGTIPERIDQTDDDWLKIVLEELAEAGTAMLGDRILGDHGLLHEVDQLTAAALAWGASIRLRLHRSVEQIDAMATHEQIILDPTFQPHD